jgi:hypothetical protein
MTPTGTHLRPRRVRDRGAEPFPVPPREAALFADVTFRIRMPHRPGTLAKISAEIGKAGAVIGDLTTVHSDTSYSVRDLTIEPTRPTRRRSRWPSRRRCPARA